MAQVNEYLEAFAKIVAIADEIRRNLGAKGEESLRQFEEAVQRNGVSFGDMVRTGGGAWGEATWTDPGAPLMWAEMRRWYPAPLPTDEQLKARFARGLKWKSQDGQWWAVTSTSETGMDQDPQGNPAVEVGPIK